VSAGVKVHESHDTIQVRCGTSGVSSALLCLECAGTSCCEPKTMEEECDASGD